MPLRDAEWELQSVADRPEITASMSAEQLVDEFVDCMSVDDGFNGPHVPSLLEARYAVCRAEILRRLEDADA